MDRPSYLDFFDKFAVDLSELCGGLRLAAQHLPFPTRTDQDGCDAVSLLALIITGLERLEKTLEDELAALMEDSV